MAIKRIKVIRIFSGDSTLLYTVTPYTPEVRLEQIISESTYLRKSKLHHQINDLVEAGKSPESEIIGECLSRDEVKLIINQHRSAKVPKSGTEKKTIKRRRTTKKTKKDE